MNAAHLHLRIPAEIMGQILSALDALPIDTPEEFAVRAIQFALKSLKQQAAAVMLGLEEQ